MTTTITGNTPASLQRTDGETRADLFAHMANKTVVTKDKLVEMKEFIETIEWACNTGSNCPYCGGIRGAGGTGHLSECVLPSLLEWATVSSE